MKRLIFIIFSILIFTLSACSGLTENQSKEYPDKQTNKTEGRKQLTTEEAKFDFPEGVQLELLNVGDNAREVFEKYFNYIEKAHENMIYRKTEKTQELFIEDREDLKNAKLIYNADRNHFTYMFYYNPRPSDLLITPDQPMMIIDISSYLYIQNSISDYLFQVKLDLQEQNIYLDNNSSVSFLFQTDRGSYIHMETVGAEALVTVKNEGDPTEYTIPGAFASAPIKVSVKNPNQSVQGKDSDEAALLEFFDIPYGALTDENIHDDHSQQKIDEEDFPSNNKKAMDNKKNMQPTDTLQYTTDEYGMSLTFPESWKGKYSVTEGEWMENVIETIDFIFVNNSQPLGNIFSLIIADMPKQEFKDYYEDSFVEFIKEVDGISIGYNMPGEPPTELFEEGNEELLDEYIRMVNVDLPEIINNIE